MERGFYSYLSRVALSGLLLTMGMGCGRRMGEEWTKQHFLCPVQKSYRLVRIPSGRVTLGSREAGSAENVKRVELEAFWLSDCEISVAQYLEYLNDQAVIPEVSTSQMVWEQGHVLSRPGKDKEPVGYVSYDDALVFCQWLSAKTHLVVRLPSEDEWEYAARGGIRKARYPWGWGEPYGRARYASSGPREVGSYPKNQFGLYDMAGNVFEWCAVERTETPSEQAVARGGSWAEKNPRMLCVYARSAFPRTYRDADVGFRIVVDEIQIPGDPTPPEI